MKRTIKTALNDGIRGLKAAFTGEKRAGAGSATPKARRWESGSTIVGVLAALVFITVVAAFMVKNTGAQAAASGGYTSDLTMQSTVGSGVRATESFFYNNPDGGLAAISALFHGDTGFIFGKNKKEKQGLSANQFFSSRLIEYDRGTQSSHIEVHSAKSKSGKAMKTARAFYILGNTKVPPGGGFGAKSVIHINGTASGDAGMHTVSGGAVFNGNLKLQNGKTIFNGPTYIGGNLEIPGGSEGEFRGNLFVKGDATFQDAITFDSQAHFQKKLTVNSPVEFNSKVYVGENAVFSGRAKFESDAYFDGNAQFMTGATTNFNDKAYFDGNFTIMNPNSGNTVFGNDVGINGRYTSGGQTINAAGDVYLNGSIADNGGFNGVGSSTSTFYYNADSVSNLTKVTNFNQGDLGGQSVRNKLNVSKADTVARQEEPRIDISRIPAELIKEPRGVIQNSSGNLDVGLLTAAYENAGFGDLYEGHLVVKVPSGTTIGPPSTVGEFDGKVIIIVEDGGTINAGQKFYTSTENSSTLVYAGAGNAQLQQFGSDGLFKGLIYIDDDNTGDNSFNWKQPNAHIKGAVHNFSSRPFMWNGGKADPVKLEFDEDALNNFASLSTAPSQTSDPDSGKTAKLEDDTYLHIDPIPGGFYFY